MKHKKDDMYPIGLTLVIFGDIGANLCFIFVILCCKVVVLMIVWSRGGGFATFQNFSKDEH